MADERLNRYLARCGVASRRGADGIIASGSVRVNGRRPPPTGMLIDPDRDKVTMAGEIVSPPHGHRYLVLNKPAGVLVTSRDPQRRNTVFDLLDVDATRGARLFPVGRLDMDSHGLLLLTDDGDLSHRLTHARFGVSKEYLAVVSGIPGEGDLRRLRAGLELEDGPTQPAEADLVRSGPGARAEVRIIISEGRNRQVRRMFDAIGHPVRELTRVGFGPLRLGRLKPGAWRKVREPELKSLRGAVTGRKASSPSTPASPAEGEEFQ